MSAEGAQLAAHRARPRRFREIVRGQHPHGPARYLSTSELLGRSGDAAVSIPVPQIELPRFRFGENKQGRAARGRARARGDGERRRRRRQGGAGSRPGQHILEVEVELEELAEMLGEELELPNIEPRGDRA